MSIETQVSYRTCPLCEATCGLEIHTHEEEVLHIYGDKLDSFSRGYFCPKGYSLKELHEDPDRIKKPMIRRGTDWQEVSWEEAFAAVREGIRPIIEAQGKNAVGVYLGNPNVHNLAGLLYGSVLIRALGSRSVFSASTMDQIPKQLTSEIMYGSDANIPVPDLDRTQYVLMIGANPFASNGSLMTAPNMRGRLKSLQERGGKMIVIDPVRTVTAKQADEHHFIRPGTDALFLFGLIHTLFEEKLIALGKLAEMVNGMAVVETLAKDFPPEIVEANCGISAETIRRLAREISQSPNAIVYGRMGICTQPFGAMNSWLIDVINILTGNLDREGGVMFTSSATRRSLPKKARKIRYNRYRSRVRDLPEVLGELPVSCLAEEIETAGPGQLKALITIAGNPALSAPNSNRLQNALEKVAFMVSVDCYLNETTKYANVLLPPPSPLEKSHYDLALYNLSIRNFAKYSSPVFDLPNGQLDEWEILTQLAAAISDQKIDGNPSHILDDTMVCELVKHEVLNPVSPIFEEDASDILALLNERKGPERLLDFYLRVGPYGDAFGKNPNGLNLGELEENPHGIDFGELQPRVQEILQTPSGKIELAPNLLVNDVKRLRDTLTAEQQSMLLVGRRDLRSNNSWLHNLPVLVKGEERCKLWIHTEDAKRLNMDKGDKAHVQSRTGEVDVTVQITEDIMLGTVSLPHGWGHDLPGTQLHVATKHAGVNMNLLTDEQEIDPISGNAVLNGIPVVIEKI